MRDNSAEILFKSFSAGGPCEQFWHGQGCSLFDDVHQASPLPNDHQKKKKKSVLSNLLSVLICHCRTEKCCEIQLSASPETWTEREREKERERQACAIFTDHQGNCFVKLTGKLGVVHTRHPSILQWKKKKKKKKKKSIFTSDLQTQNSIYMNTCVHKREYTTACISLWCSKQSMWYMQNCTQHGNTTTISTWNKLYNLATVFTLGAHNFIWSYLSTDLLMLLTGQERKRKKSSRSFSKEKENRDGKKRRRRRKRSRDRERLVHRYNIKIS